MIKKDFFAEIIESSLGTWSAQSWQWNNFPVFGSIVVVENGDNITNEKSKLFAVVHNIQTGSIDSSRQPFAYKKTEQELLNEQPQIFEFLKTTFNCLILGYQENNSTFYMFPPKPPKIHSFIRNATESEYLEFFKNTQYLQILFGHSNQIFNLDELLLALLKNLNQINIFQEQQFDDFIEKFCLLTCNDYRRLKLFLNRLSFIAK